MTAYSSFFSSGLLAPPATIYSRKALPIHGFDDEDTVDACQRMTGLSPAAPSSPMAIPDDSDMETGFKVPNRVAIPTPEPRPRTLSSLSGNDIMLSNCDSSATKSDMEIAGANAASSPGSNFGKSMSRSLSPPPNGRRLRKRRSSLAGATSPLNGIKSPSRSIGHALELQMHLLGSPTMARGSGVSLAAVATDIMLPGGNGAEQNRSLARLRSGSMTSFKRRPLRRVSRVPPAPPPTAPLPELPPSLMDTPICSFLPTPTVVRHNSIDTEHSYLSQ
ncbi:hypothetical protein APHAL10511_000282 [Amanita phalloides]|nr:hypothetical protein APHAL10511_000282 [Amanita phalloides]